MQLNTTITASPYDEDYDMALMYCWDENKKYCFSLSRPVDEEEVEIMVSDQINEKINDLSLELHDDHIKVSLSQEVARRLDGNTNYKINFILNQSELNNVIEALNEIFKRKKGFSNNVL